MTEKVDIFMPLYVGDYLADTTDLTTEEHGAYFLLLLNLWKRGGRLACDPARLARIAGLALERWEATWLVLGRFFDLDDGHIAQRRLSRELETALGRKRRASHNGRKGNETRWGKRNQQLGSPPDAAATNTAIATASPKHRSSPSPSPSQRFLTGVADTARPSARVVKAKKDPRVGQVFGWFREAWQKQYGGGWAAEPGVASNVGSLLTGLDELPNSEQEFARLPQAIGRFLKDDRKHLVEAKHPLRLFCQDANKYRHESTASTASTYARLG